MNDLIAQVHTFFKNATFDWAFCGGCAIDLFIGEQTRPHLDIDLAVFWEDRNAIIDFMLRSVWRVFEACGGGIIHELRDVPHETLVKRNLFCLPGSNRHFQLKPLGDDAYQFHIDWQEQTRFDYVEFLFNQRDSGFFYYSRNMAIKRVIDKAVLDLNALPVLAPEIALLYKSSYYNYLHTVDPHINESISRSRHDFTVTLPALHQEQRQWLTAALVIEYPDGHEWLQSLEPTAC